MEYIQGKPVVPNPITDKLEDCKDRKDILCRIFGPIEEDCLGKEKLERLERLIDNQGVSWEFIDRIISGQYRIIDVGQENENKRIIYVGKKAQ